MAFFHLENFPPSLSRLDFSEISSPSSALSWASLIQNPLFSSQKTLLVFSSSQELKDFETAFRFFDPETPLYILEGWQSYPSDQWFPSIQMVSERMKWLYHATLPESAFFATTIYNLSQKTLPLEVFQEKTTTWECQKDHLPLDLKSFFQNLGYKEAPFCETPGTFALRGGMFDVFSPALNSPVRVEQEGSQIYSLKSVDIESQRSEGSLEKLVLIPSLETLFFDQDVCEPLLKSLEKRKVSASKKRDWVYKLQKQQFFLEMPFLLEHFYPKLSRPLDFFQTPFSTVVFRPNMCQLSLENLKNEAEEPEDFINFNFSKNYSSHSDSLQAEDSFCKTFFVSEVSSENDQTILSSKSFFKESGDPFSQIEKLKAQGVCVFIASSHRSDQDKIKILIEKKEMTAHIVKDEEYLWSSWIQDQKNNKSLIHIIPRSLNDRIYLKNIDVAFLRQKDLITSHSQSKKVSKQKNISQIKRASALSFGELATDDYLIHKSHGIGIYKGIEHFSSSGVEGEFLKIEYRGGDKLYLPVLSLDRVHRYSGKGSLSILDKLGDKKWALKKQKITKEIESIAGELLKIYALRKESKREAYIIESEALEKFEKDFPFEETGEQRQAIEDVFHDMRRDFPMDRLVCGEVGSGKTEVAQRATFVASQNKKQVAILAPTTLLSFQHFQTFQKRFRNTGFKIGLVNRFVEAKVIKKTLADLENGKLDILIGTHRLLSRDVKFKNLGLLVVDEEQKFGVVSKEKIKKLKQDVDILTLSATPIPRTLHFSLIGIRDLSLIKELPPGRLPIKTFISHDEDSVIQRAIKQELERGGQVFFMHNRVEALPSFYEKIKKLVPEAKCSVVHGRMKNQELEETMLDFLNKKTQVLICTSLIESGLDIPQANTLIVSRPDLLGLSQLYQLRGRVGRSHIKAYCYLLIPSQRNLQPETLERLKVVEENSTSGSGLQIAQHDLNIRGAGPLLGKKQAGLADSLGYEFFMELLSDVLNNLKGEQRDLFSPEVNLNVSAFLPSDYISHFKMRLIYYRDLSLLETKEEVNNLEQEMQDRFGKLPDPVMNLIKLSLVTQICKKLRVSQMKLTKKYLSLEFDETTPVSSEKIMSLIQSEPQKYKLKSERKLVVYETFDIDTASNFLEELES